MPPPTSVLGIVVIKESAGEPQRTTGNMLLDTHKYWTIEGPKALQESKHFTDHHGKGEYQVISFIGCCVFFFSMLTGSF